MTKKIAPDLFARLMKLSSEARRDLLEFLGQTPADADFAVHNAGLETMPHVPNETSLCGSPTPKK